jgi:hypothetical protein
MKIYNYSPLTGEYVSESDAAPSPREPDVYLVPANATIISPPTTEAGYAAVFANDAWTTVEDHRGSQYWNLDGSAHVVKELGPLPADALLTNPKSDLEEAKAEQNALITLNCQQAIVSNFISYALGSAYNYPNKITDQLNFNTLLISLSYSAETELGLLCEDSLGVWASRLHTRAQFLQVAADRKVHINQALEKKNKLVNTIESAATVDAVKAIIW